DQSPDAWGGHGFYQIGRLLTSTRGTSEQYASAYAVMARALGFDSRVVMGFRPSYDHDTFRASGSDVDAWVEVDFIGLGWITIDPSPRENPIGTRPNAPRAPASSLPLDDPLKQATQTPPPAAAPEMPDAAAGTSTAHSGQTAARLA